MKKISIYTDGSCLGNPGFGGWGAIVLDNGKEKILKGGEQKSTNNRMELRAIIEAIRWINNNCTDTTVHIFSDSNLFIQSITKGWKRKKNLDLWEEFEDLNAEFPKSVKIEWHWVKGHSDNIYNQKVDRVAVQEAKKQKKSIK